MTNFLPIDRKSVPKVKMTDHFDFLKAVTSELDNGIALHYINAGEQEIVRLQFVFTAGSVLQNQPLVASSVNSLVLEGTSKYTSLEIANLIESKGAFIEANSLADYAVITLHCLIKELKNILPILSEVFFQANFPEEEIENYLTNKKQGFIVNSEKVGFIAKNNFLEIIFGEKHSYNNKLKVGDFEKVNRAALIDFYKSCYIEGKMEVYAAGKVEKETIELINQNFGQHKKIENEGANGQKNLVIEGEKDFLLNKEGALQSAIRFGTPTILKSHVDFPTLFIANTILGGYFGSRLMSNIREDKGFTYGVGSAIVSFKDAAYFVISTEVGTEVTNAAVKEIEMELVRMADELVTEKELNLVKNYLKGSLMRGFDGAFAAMDRFLMLQTLGLNYLYYENLFGTISDVTSSSIREVSVRYLRKEAMKKIIVGKAEE